MPLKVRIFQNIIVRSGIRTHAWRTRLRPERSALDRSAILTLILDQNDIVRRCVPFNPIGMKMLSSLGGLEPPTFRLTAERANRLRHRDAMSSNEQ